MDMGMLILAMVMVMVMAMVMVMVMVMDMAMVMAMEVMAMDMVVMDIVDTMERGLLMLSLAMDIMDKGRGKTDGVLLIWDTKSSMTEHKKLIYRNLVLFSLVTFDNK